MQEIAKGLPAALPEDNLLGWRTEITLLKQQEQHATAESRIRAEELERLIRSVDRARSGGRPWEAIELLRSLGRLHPESHRQIEELARVIEEECRSRALSATAQLRALVRSGLWTEEYELAKTHGELAHWAEGWRKAIQSLPGWSDLWKRAIAPALELARRGDYRGALRLSGEALSSDFPGLDEQRSEWLAQIPPLFRIETHADGLSYVQIGSGVWLSQTPVTVGAYREIMERRLNLVVGRGGQKLNEPIVNRPFRDAETYCRAAGGRLPSSDEWVIAARAHSEWSYPWGNEISWGYACYGAAALEEVKKYPMTRNGFYDLCGNVWEWCSDLPAPGSSKRTAIGGCFRSGPEELRIDARTQRDPDGHDDVGFRCVLPQDFFTRR